MRVYRIDPLQDFRWGEFVERHPRASVFHTPGWLNALRRTYGYEPVVLTTSPPTAELTNGLVLCRIHSWLTGRRMVSLPFSDHCAPLVDRMEDLKHLNCSLERDLEKEHWKFIEIRPLDAYLDGQSHFEQFQTFYFHKLDLGPAIDELFRNFHKDCVQRKVRRAEREALMYEEGRSSALLNKFYHLLLQTRRRQHLPPHPREWFRNLIECLGGQLQIRVVSKGGRPVASILTLCYRDSMVYKYGCSDAGFNNLGGMQLLFWRTIKEAHDRGLHEFDLGRSDCDNPGLVTFKDRWGSTRSTLTYLRYPGGHVQTNNSWKMRVAKRIFARIPNVFLIAAGRLMYKHIE